MLAGKEYGKPKGDETLLWDITALLGHVSFTNEGDLIVRDAADYRIALDKLSKFSDEKIIEKFLISCNFTGKLEISLDMNEEAIAALPIEGKKLLSLLKALVALRSVQSQESPADPNS